MSARMILHLVVTLVLLAIGWYLYMGLKSGSGYDSVSVATYWFAVLVFILFSWLFYWIVHRFKAKAWVIALILAIAIAAISTFSLLYISQEHQQKLEEEAMLEEQAHETPQEEQAQESEQSVEIETLNLSEEIEELPEVEVGTEE